MRRLVRKNRMYCLVQTGSEAFALLGKDHGFSLADSLVAAVDDGLDGGAVGLDPFPQVARRMVVVRHGPVRAFLRLEVAVEDVAVARVAVAREPVLS